jgi:hypothetical protein
MFGVNEGQAGARDASYEDCPRCVAIGAVCAPGRRRGNGAERRRLRLGRFVRPAAWSGCRDNTGRRSSYHQCGCCYDGAAYARGGCVTGNVAVSHQPAIGVVRRPERRGRHDPRVHPAEEHRWRDLHVVRLYRHGPAGREQASAGSEKQLPKTLVTLAPGQVAHVEYSFSDVPSGTATSCPTSTYVQITPPDETDYLLVTEKLGPCQGGEIGIGAVQPGGIPASG